MFTVENATLPCVRMSWMPWEILHTMPELAPLPANNEHMDRTFEEFVVEQIDLPEGSRQRCNVVLVGSNLALSTFKEGKWAAVKRLLWFLATQVGLQGAFLPKNMAHVIALDNDPRMGFKFQTLDIWEEYEIVRPGGELK